MIETTEVKNESPKCVSFTSFSGADAIFMINNRVFGEVNGIQMQQLLAPKDGEPEIRGLINAVIFDRESPIYKTLVRSKKPRLKILFQNEYGQSMVLHIKNPQFGSRVVRLSADDILMSETYDFIAKGMRFQRGDFRLKTQANGYFIKKEQPTI